MASTFSNTTVTGFQIMTRLLTFTVLSCRQKIRSKSVNLARWWERAVDVIPASSGKAAAIKEVLKYYGFSAEECMAFGDGGNDIDMIKFAGIGVAMGNSDEEVKMAADHVTDTCDNDGIYKAFKYFKMI